MEPIQGPPPSSSSSSSPLASPPSPSPSPPAVPSPSTAGDAQSSSPSSSIAPPAASQQSPVFKPELSALAAEGERERHPKSRRKRTAAKDKAILEAAYNANPKPDKAARLEIVKRVSLNEKEVQIWFQNRRQNDRRKSRPLSPQEIAALRYGGMQILSSDPAPYNSSFSSENNNNSPVRDMLPPEQPAASPLQPGSAASPPSAEPEKAREEYEVPQVPQDAGRWEEREMPGGNKSAMPILNGGHSGETRRLLSRSFSGSVGYLSNRWNAASSSSTPSQHDVRDDSLHNGSGAFPSSWPPSIASASILPPLGSRTSQIRLSTSLDGKAEVVPSIPSPPRPVAAPPTPDALQALGSLRRPNLQRRHSSSSSITLPPISALTSTLSTGSAPLPPRLTRGRSRDVHAWEFCCVAEGREDALTKQAKEESSGSATAAISLLRSTSMTGTSPLQQSSSAKRNASMTKAAPRSALAKKPKLGRAMSSVARMQSTLGPSERHNVQRDYGAPPNKAKTNTLAALSGDDSDKENWSPDEDGNPRASPFDRPAPTNNGLSGRRPLPSGPPRIDSKHPRRTPAQAHQEARSPAFLSSRAYTAPARSFPSRRGKRAESPIEIYEDSENNNSPASRPVLDDELKQFMSAVSPSKKGDVDAVAGLLSLSQGAWR